MWMGELQWDLANCRCRYMTCNFPTKITASFAIWHTQMQTPGLPLFVFVEANFNFPISWQFLLGPGWKMTLEYESSRENEVAVHFPTKGTAFSLEISPLLLEVQQIWALAPQPKERNFEFCQRYKMLVGPLEIYKQYPLGRSTKRCSGQVDLRVYCVHLGVTRARGRGWAFTKEGTKCFLLALW